GWPSGPNGYTDLIDGLLDSPLISVQTDIDVSLANLQTHVNRLGADLVVLTCPLDAFTGNRFGELEWRGIIVRSVHIPNLDLAQGAMVVNYPGREYPFIRIHETKHASRQEIPGTVLGFEFAGAPTRYYPIELPRNRALNDQYQGFLREEIGSERIFFAGRLANYVYIDMDDCMRQAIDTASQIVEHLTASRR
ncbi:MAG: UDP-galactopyranose mutase, partial [Solirubrobacteraceae bacterium]